MKSYMNDELEFQRLMIALRKLQDRNVAFGFKMGPAHLFTIISQMQLALKHPNNTGGRAETARKVVDLMIGKLAEAHPPLFEMLNAGFSDNGQGGAELPDDEPSAGGGK